MARVIWTGPALIDIRNIADYIAVDSEAAADAMVDRLFAAPSRLETHPYAGGEIDQLRDRGVREVLCGNYRLFYVVRDEGCYITAVLHASRDLARAIEPRMWKPEL